MFYSRLPIGSLLAELFSTMRLLDYMLSAPWYEKWGDLGVSQNHVGMGSLMPS